MAGGAWERPFRREPEPGVYFLREYPGPRDIAVWGNPSERSGTLLVKAPGSALVCSGT